MIIPENWRSLLAPQIALQIAEPNENDCWRWMGKKKPDGYVRPRIEGRFQYLHRYVYAAVIGPVPIGLELDHLCRVHDCCNPLHLEPVTHKENTLRGVGAPAVNARKTHCERGHLLAGDNLIGSKKRSGRRGCRLCNKEYQRDYYKNVTRHREQAKQKLSETFLEGLP